jgi:NADPH:quinone reductase-like Zn-dependent oxidoreductase
VQIAAAGGAEVTAGVRRAGQAGLLLRTGVDRVLVGAARPPAPFDVILDTVGGDSLARSLVNLAPGGTCVVCGNSSDEPTTFMARDFYRVGNVRLHGFFLEPALRGRGARPGLEMLLAMVRRGELTIPITARASWKEIQRVAVQLSDRSIDGKAVLSVGSDPA